MLNHLKSTARDEIKCHGEAGLDFESLKKLLHKHFGGWETVPSLHKAFSPLPGLFSYTPARRTQLKTATPYSVHIAYGTASSKTVQSLLAVFPAFFGDVRFVELAVCVVLGDTWGVRVCVEGCVCV